MALTCVEPTSSIELRELREAHAFLSISPEYCELEDNGEGQGRRSPYASDSSSQSPTARTRPRAQLPSPPARTAPSGLGGSAPSSAPARSAEREAFQMLWTLLTTYVLGKRSVGDILSVAADPSVPFRLARAHREQYLGQLEAFHEVSLSRVASARSLPGTHALDGCTLLEAAAAAVFARAAYGALMRRGGGDTPHAFLGGAASLTMGRWGHEEHTAAFVELADVPRSDVLLASWSERTFEPVFVVFWEHRLRWLVLAVRGSAEWTSVLTDLAAETCEIAGGCAHSGMVRAARWVVGQVAPIARQALAERPEYELVCTGHSLGANVAALAALLLREGCPQDQGPPPGAPVETLDNFLATPEVPLAPTFEAKVKAYVFGASPLMSPKLAERCAPYVLSVARNVDFVTRLSAFNVDRLLLELTEQSAPKLARQWILNALGKKGASDSYRSAARQRAFGEGAAVAEVLVPPGHVVHMDQLGCADAKQRPRPPPRVFQPLPGFYQRLFVSPKMFEDHIPVRYVEDLLQLSRAAFPAHGKELYLQGRSARDPEAQRRVLLGLTMAMAALQQQEV